MPRLHLAPQLEAVYFYLALLPPGVHIVRAVVVLLYNLGLADCFLLSGGLDFDLGQLWGWSSRQEGSPAVDILEGHRPRVDLTMLDLPGELVLHHFCDSAAMCRWVGEPSDCTEIKVAGLELMWCDSDTLGERGYFHLNDCWIAQRPDAAALLDPLDPRENRRRVAKPFRGSAAADVGIGCE